MKPLAKGRFDSVADSVTSSVIPCDTGNYCYRCVSSPSAMSKVERLNARVSKLLTAAVQEVLEAVRETVSEYQEKTARTQRENERLRRRLQELQELTSNRHSGENR